METLRDPRRPRAAPLARRGCLRRAELAEGQTSVTVSNGLAIRRALEAAGIEFIDRMLEGRAFDDMKDGEKRTLV